MSDDDSRASTSSSSSSSSNQQTEKETNTPKKKESKVSVSKNCRLLSTGTERIQEELADVTLGTPPESWSPKGEHACEWTVTIPGPPDPRTKVASSSLVSEHRFKPPKVTFPTRTCHSHINRLGVLCVDL